MGGAKNAETPEEFCPFSWEKKSKQETQEDEEQLQHLLEEARQYNASITQG